MSAITGGSLDILINNGAYLDMAHAGVLPSQLTEPRRLEVFVDAMNKSVESNVVGAVFVTNAFLTLIERGEGEKIVHITIGHRDADFILGTGFAALCRTAQATPC